MNKYLSHGIILLFLVISTSSLNAQSKKYKLGKHKCVRMELIDPGELYSTYEFEQSEIDQLTAAGFSLAQIELIKRHHIESGWPTELGNFDVRIENAEKIKTYVVYKVAEIGDKYILVAPAKYNKEMGDGWMPAQDIYFVIGKVGAKQFGL